MAGSQTCTEKVEKRNWKWPGVHEQLINTKTRKQPMHDCAYVWIVYVRKRIDKENNKTAYCKG